MGLLPAATTRVTGASITAASFNSDFSALKTWADVYPLLTDTARTVTAVITFSTAPVFSAAQAFAAAVTMAVGATITTGGLTVSAGGITVTGNSTITGTLGGVTTLTATTFSGSGASLTNLPAAQLTGTLPALSGANLTALNGSQVTTGTVADARLPTTLGGKTFSAATRVDGAVTVGANGSIDFEATNPVETIAFNFNQYQAVAGSNTPDPMDNTCPVSTPNGWSWIKVNVDSGLGWIPVCME